jgi:hypothetical protein
MNPYEPPQTVEFSSEPLTDKNALIFQVFGFVCIGACFAFVSYVRRGATMEMARWFIGGVLLSLAACMALGVLIVLGLVIYIVLYETRERGVSLK